MGTKRSVKPRCAQRAAAGRSRSGMAMIPALIVTSLVAMMGLSMLMANMNGARVVNYQGDEFKLTSAVESVGVLATERIWSSYLAANEGVPGGIQSVRDFLDAPNGPLYIPNDPQPGPPEVGEGVDLLPLLALPVDQDGDVTYDDVTIDALEVTRHDDGDATLLYLTVSASNQRGGDLVNPILNRAIQLVYTIEPEDFEGFDYGVLANNVNCIFCHTVVDTTERFYNPFPERYGSFDRARIGTLESLVLRDSADGHPGINDWDADSFVAGSVYVRGSVLDHDGDPISDWGSQTFGSFLFDSAGHLVEDQWGQLTPAPFNPAGDPPQPFENLYLDYPTEYGDMVDGKLPTAFPPPFPDDGGIDPATGLPSSAGAGNRRVDPGEFAALAEWAEGSISGGAIHVAPHGADAIDTEAELFYAMYNGNRPSVASGVHANVVLTGTEADPIVIDGDIAIQGDVVISGYVKGTGSIYATGNVYIPSNLRYLDGQMELDGEATGIRTYGIAADGQKNALGLAAGGNVLVGDYLKPSIFVEHDQYDIVSGDSTGDWNFALAEISLFNRAEWAKTQQYLPGYGEDPADTASWTAPNPGYVEGYLPRYYNFGPGDEIPIYNRGQLYFDPSTGSWHGDEEVPTAWDPRKLSLLDPNALGEGAVVSQVTPHDGWMSDEMQKLALEHLEAQHAVGTPLEIDALLYTNNSIFGIVHRQDAYRGQLQVNGALICPDLGLLAPGLYDPSGGGAGTHPPGSPFRIGLRLNYDARLRDELNIKNPNQVTLRRKLWNPTANLL